MHRQIGNAVPVPVAHALGRELRKVLYQRWKVNLDEAIWIDDDDEDEASEHHLGIANSDSDDEMYTD
jgi:DNA (cytosine-5)-methyltransferase 1